MIGSIEIKTRPLRIAFLVDPNNISHVRDAIRLSSSLWGGVFAPIIPMWRRMPANWQDRPFKRPLAKDVILGYLEAFDPDVLVQFATRVPDFVTATRREIIQPSAIWDVLKTPRPFSPKFGIGVFELFEQVFQDHFRYKSKYPVRVILPRPPKSYSLFWASVFGELPHEVERHVNQRFRKPLEIEDVVISVEKLGELLSPNVLFPRRVVQYGLQHTNRFALRDRANVFFMDASRVDDIVDFWNLRAVGRAVLAVPKQFQDDPALMAFTVEFLKANRRQWPHNPKVFDFASMIRSRNSTMEQMEAFARTLKFDPAPDDPAPGEYLSLQHWYPRIWHDPSRRQDGYPDDVYFKDEIRDDLRQSDQEHVRVKSVLPEFADELVFHGEPRCGNDISFHIYGTDQYFAEVLPSPAGDQVIRAVGGYASLEGDWRISRRGLSHLVKSDFAASVPVPIAEDVMIAWLADLGWTVELSPPGILAKQILRQLDGQVGPLRSEPFLGLLEYMNGGSVHRDGSPVTDPKVRPELERDLPIGEVKTRLGSSRGVDHDYLLSKGVFRLGIRIQCPTCLRNSWFSLTTIGEQFTCPKCLQQFPALGNLTSGMWTYKTAGPFSVPAYGEGAYSVLLTLDFFNDHRLSTFKRTPLVSFKAKGPGKTDLEADFAFLWEEAVFGERMDGLVIGECKTYGQFRDKDFARMRDLARVFPGAILVFSTLRKSLTDVEKTAIIRIAKAGRKHWKGDRPINPVLILTANELMSWHGPPYCWDESVRQKFDVHGILRLCDATQQLYLGLPSWQTEWHQAWEKKRAKYAAKIRTKSPTEGN